MSQREEVLKLTLWDMRFVHASTETLYRRAFGGSLEACLAPSAWPTVLLPLVFLTACAPRVPATSPSLGIDVCARAPAYAEESTFFASAEVEDANSIDLPATGDLWPSCSSGTTLFTAWGDGYGFTHEHDRRRPDIGVGVLHGLPGAPAMMQGRNRVTDDRHSQKVFRVWTPGAYYQKPTGMLCRGGRVYLAVQDLGTSYDDAAAATIAESKDGGETWVEGDAPMFSRGRFTTLMFLDTGPDGRDARDDYVYVYGLDFNFRGSPRVKSPQGLFLARVAAGKSLRDLSAWEWFSGDPVAPSWTLEFSARRPVLVDCTRRHAADKPPGYPVIAQGGVVYDAPLARYIYTSWSEYTFEFYEAETPWGPWRRFLSKDFGMPPWTDAKHGGYATSAPSSWISSDGKTLWVQSNTWSAGVEHNNLALRKLTLSPRVSATP